MAITDDVRKTLTDPTPLYFMAGTADLAAQKLKEVPSFVEKIVAEAPERLNAVRNADPKVVQERVSQQAKEAQGKLNEMLGTIDTDIKRLRDTAQDLALQGVGRAAELAVKARERYDEVAEHGQEVVRTWRGEAADEVVDIAGAIEPHEGRDGNAAARSKAPSQSVAMDSSKEAPKSAAKPATPAPSSNSGHSGHAGHSGHSGHSGAQTSAASSSSQAKKAQARGNKPATPAKRPEPKSAG